MNCTFDSAHPHFTVTIYDFPNLPPGNDYLDCRDLFAERNTEELVNTLTDAMLEVNGEELFS